MFYNFSLAISNLPPSRITSLRFIHLCQTSVQLVLSRAELPLLELVDSKHTLEDSQSYLRDYFNSLLVESQSYVIDDNSDRDGSDGGGGGGEGVKSSSSVVAGTAPQKSSGQAQGQGQGRSEKTSFGLLIEVGQSGPDGQGHWCPLSDNLDYQLLVSAESTADQEDQAKGERQRQLGTTCQSPDILHSPHSYMTSHVIIRHLGHTLSSP